MTEIQNPKSKYMMRSCRKGIVGMVLVLLLPIFFGCEPEKENVYLSTFDYPESVSPDGTRLIYAHGILKTRDFYLESLFVLNLEDSIKFTLNDDVNDGSPKEAIWSVDGTKIFSTNGVFAFNGMGITSYRNWGNVTNYPSSYSGKMYELSLSPDNSRLIYLTSTHFWGTWIPTCFISKTDFSENRELTFIEDAWAEYPKWMADGTRLVFSKYVSASNAEIYTCDTLGNAQVRLTTNLGFDGEPACSPDGTKIAWRKMDAIYVMNVDGSNPFYLDDGCHPIWTPDSKSIIYSKTMEIKENGESDGLIHIISLATKEKSQLTFSTPL